MDGVVVVVVLGSQIMTIVVGILGDCGFLGRGGGKGGGESGGVEDVMVLEHEVIWR